LESARGAAILGATFTLKTKGKAAMRRIAIHDYCGHPSPFQLSRELARRGHAVRHFYFAEDAGPKGRAHRSIDDPDGFSVEAVSLNQPYSKTDLIRRRQADIRYGKLASARIAAFAPDIVISGNTPLEAQVPILARAHRAGSAFVFWLQDFYSLAASKILSRKIPVLGPVIGAYYRSLEARMLRQSDGVLLISEDFRPAIEELGVDRRVMEVMENWGSLEELPTRPKDTDWARQNGLNDKFVFLYSGTLALKHNPDLLWALAAHFENDPEVVVAVIASGVSYEALKVRAAAERRRNLMLLPLQPISVFPDVLGAADVLVGLLENDAGPFSVPSKVLNYLCAGRPILLSAPTDNLSARIIESAGAGTCVPAGDRDAFVAAAARLRAQAPTRAEFGAAGRAYAEGTFDIVAIADRFETVLAKAVSRSRLAA
jgi:glycosyltransferase involved in cell wall biosynthesis